MRDTYLIKKKVGNKWQVIARNLSFREAQQLKKRKLGQTPEATFYIWGERT